MHNHTSSWGYTTRHIKPIPVSPILMALAAFLITFQSLNASDDQQGKGRGDEVKACAVLALDVDDDTLFWKDALVEKFQYECVGVLRSDRPTLEELEEAFSWSANWIFIGSHYTDDYMHSNEEEKEKRMKIFLKEDHVLIQDTDETVRLDKGVQFRMHESAKVVFFRGCNTLADDKVIRDVRKLFHHEGKYPTIIGWRGRTGWEVSHVAMGGFGHDYPMPQYDFFEILAETDMSGQDVIRSWGEAITTAFWGAGSKVEESVSCIDSEGREWVINGGKLVLSGREFE